MVSSSEIHTMCLHHILFASQCMLEADLKKKFQEVTGKSGDDASYGVMITTMGENLELIKLQIKRFTHFNDERRYIGLINTAEDGASKYSSVYNYSQLQFFNHLIEAIAMSTPDEGGIVELSSISALNLDTSAPSQLSQVDAPAVAAGKKLTRSEKQALIEDLVKGKWLDKADGGHLRIGPRTFLELGSRLVALPDLPEVTKNVWSKKL